MDVTSCTLLLAMMAALCAAMISGWLLHTMTEMSLFITILVVDVVFSQIGLMVPWYLSRHYDSAVVPTTNIFSSALSAMAALFVVVIFDQAVLKEVPGDRLASETLVRMLIASAGISMSTSLVLFLILYTIVQEAADIRRLLRRIRKWSCLAPQARVQLCDDLEAAAPGECAICLGDLADLPAELAHAPAARPGFPGRRRREMENVGLLRMPCGHTFHAQCAERWMNREVTCAMCRRKIGSLSTCTRICLPAEGPCEVQRPSHEGNLDDTTENVEVRKQKSLPELAALPVGDIPEPDVDTPKTVASEGCLDRVGVPAFPTGRRLMGGMRRAAESADVDRALPNDDGGDGPEMPHPTIRVSASLVSKLAL